MLILNRRRPAFLAQPYGDGKRYKRHFAAIFPASTAFGVKIQPNRKRRISCEATPLIKQAGGWLATAIVLQFGKQHSKQQLMQLVNAVLETLDDRMLERANERAEEFQVTTGMEMVLMQF